jgi:hypothetical protein
MVSLKEVSFCALLHLRHELKYCMIFSLMFCLYFQLQLELKYDLYGVIEHSSLPNNDHYVCVIHSSPSSWHLMNDSLVGFTSCFLFPFMTRCFHLVIVMHLLQVDSITEKSTLRHEAYVLFYVRQGMFPWFSNLLNEAKETNPQRTSVQHEHDVFGFEKLYKDFFPQCIIWSTREYVRSVSKCLLYR